MFKPNYVLVEFTELTLMAFNNAYVAFSSILNRLIHQTVYEYRLFAPRAVFLDYLLYDSPKFPHSSDRRPCKFT